MKKLFFGVLAIAMMVGCAKDQVIRTQAPAHITFENAFVQGVGSSASRAAADPSFTTNSTNAIDAFDVWGYMDVNTGVVFDKERVTKTVDEDGAIKWTYENLAYWTSNHAYYFAALAPVDHDNISVALADQGKYMKAEGLGTVTFTNIDGTDDLIYAEATTTTTDVSVNAPLPVKLTFKHLLSKVKFTFSNGFANANNTLEVSNIRMIVPANGTIDLTKKPFAWAVNVDANAPTAELKLGAMTDKDGNSKIAISTKGECADERLTIPVAVNDNIKPVYEVYFDVVLYQGTEPAYKGTKKTVIEGVTLEPGKAYNFYAVLNHTNVADQELLPIEFEVEVEDWVYDAATGESFLYDGGEIETETVK